MTIDNVLKWYEKNVNYKLTKEFLEFLIKIGIIKKDINIDLLNSFLLETYNNEFIKHDEKFKIKENRIPIIEKHKNKAKKKEEKNISIYTETEQDLKSKLIMATNVTPADRKKSTTKFKIEALGGKKMKLIKL